MFLYIAINIIYCNIKRKNNIKIKIYKFVFISINIIKYYNINNI